MKIYEYKLTFQLESGAVEAVLIDATDAGHAYSEAMDDADIWPDEATLISIERGELRPYEA